MDDKLTSQLLPGVMVKVTQQTPHRDRTWVNEVQGTVIEFSQKPTGSWYAHSKNDKLWLDRLKLKLADGELMDLNLDEFSSVEIL